MTRGLLLALWTVTALFVVALALPLDGAAVTVRDIVLGNAAVTLPAVVIAARAALVPADRRWASVLALGIAAFATGNVVYLSWVQYQDPVPFPTAADAGYLGLYPFALLGVLLSLRAPAGRLRSGIVLDTVMAGLAAAAFAVWVFEPFAPHFEGDLLAYAVSLAYPVGDVALITTAIAVMIAGGGHRPALYRYLAAGLLVFVVADALYAHRVATGTYEVGTVLDAGWALGLTLMAHGAWRADDLGRREPGVRAQSLWLAAAAGLAALVVLVAATEVPVPRLAVALAAASLLLGAVRTVDAFVRVRDLAVAQAEARTDDLTGIANRRALMDRLHSELHTRVNGHVVGLAILDLDRFKDVNDSLGHHAGDELLRLVAERLTEATEADTFVARLGGGRVRAAERAHHGGRPAGRGPPRSGGPAAPVRADGDDRARRRERRRRCRSGPRRESRRPAALRRHRDVRREGRPRRRGDVPGARGPHRPRPAAAGGRPLSRAGPR